VKYCSFGIKQQALNHYKNVLILQEKIDKVLQLIQNADPTGETQPDTQEMLQLEGKELFRGSFLLLSFY
jgi:DNA-directed RNA polymerase specialized sigma54-like protein